MAVSVEDVSSVRCDLSVYLLLAGFVDGQSHTWNDHFTAKVYFTLATVYQYLPVQVK